jgi:type I restriction-modification system DNA methylase subunit
MRGFAGWGGGASSLSASDIIDLVRSPRARNQARLLTSGMGKPAAEQGESFPYLNDGASFADLVALKGRIDIGDQINKKIVAPLARANKLGGFPDFNASDKVGSGKQKQDTLTNLIAVFEDPALNFTRNRAEGDDILGDACEYLMRDQRDCLSTRTAATGFRLGPMCHFRRRTIR